MKGPTEQDPSRFFAGRPSGLRRPPPWHRLAYVSRALDAKIETLSAALAVPREGRVLDYGCADVPYRRLFADTTEFLAADLPGNRQATVEIAADGTLPLADASVDAVLSTQVLEHVGDPERYLSECFRVLRPGGRMLLSTHGIMAYHPDPVDYWRWTGAGLQRIVVCEGFEVERFEGVMGLAATGLQLIHDALHQRLPPVIGPVAGLVLQTLISVAERLQPEHGRTLNALVFALVARKPAHPSRV